MITQRLCIRYQVLFKVATATLLLFAFGFAERSNAQESRSIELQIEEMGGPKNLEEMESWLTNFYRSPRPDKVVPLAARSFAYFDSKRQSPVPILLFLAELFQKHPDRLNQWIEQTQLFPQYRSRFWEALWIAQTPATISLITQLRESSADGDNRSQIGTIMEVVPLKPRSMPINTPESIDAMWGAFYAAGEDWPIIRLVDVIDANVNGRPGNSEGQFIRGAMWPLSSHVRNHPRVKEILLTEIAKRPKLRAQLFAITRE